MTIKQKVEAEMKDAMKKKDQVRLSVLRMIKADLLVKEKETGKSLDDAAAEEALRKMFSKYKKAKEEYSALGKQDEVERYARDLEVIKGFMSVPMMGEDQIKEALEELVSELGATGPKEFGKVMKAFMAAHGNADGKIVSSILKEMLNK